MSEAKPPRPIRISNVPKRLQNSFVLGPGKENLSAEETDIDDMDFSDEGSNHSQGSSKDLSTGEEEGIYTKVDYGKLAELIKHGARQELEAELRLAKKKENSAKSTGVTEHKSNDENNKMDEIGVELGPQELEEEREDFEQLQQLQAERIREDQLREEISAREKEALKTRKKLDKKRKREQENAGQSGAPEEQKSKKKKKGKEKKKEQNTKQSGNVLEEPPSDPPTSSTLSIISQKPTAENLPNTAMNSEKPAEEFSAQGDGSPVVLSPTPMTPEHLGVNPHRSSDSPHDTPMMFGDQVVKNQKEIAESLGRVQQNQEAILENQREIKSFIEMLKNNQETVQLDQAKIRKSLKKMAKIRERTPKPTYLPFTSEEEIFKFEECSDEEYDDLKNYLSQLGGKDLRSGIDSCIHEIFLDQAIFGLTYKDKTKKDKKGIRQIVKVGLRQMKALLVVKAAVSESPDFDPPTDDTFKYAFGLCLKASKERHRSRVQAEEASRRKAEKAERKRLRREARAREADAQQ